MTNYERLALSDKAKGIMPADIARRPDAVKLWAAYRRLVGPAQQAGADLSVFVAGWDASAGRVSEDRR